MLIAFNASASEPEDDIGIAATMGALPADVLGAVFGAPPEVFAKLPRLTERVVIARKPGCGGSFPVAAGDSASEGGQMDLGIKGRTAVVTGGDSGMGYAMAEMLLREGVRVVLTDLPGAPLDAAMAALKPLGELVAVPASVRRPACKPTTHPTRYRAVRGFTQVSPDAKFKCCLMSIKSSMCLSS